MISTYIQVYECIMNIIKHLQQMETFKDEMREKRNAWSPPSDKEKVC